MSLYGYFNTFLSLLFHAARPGMGAPASQSGTSAAAAPGVAAKPPQSDTGHGARPVPQSEGLGQLGLILQALLGLGLPQAGGAGSDSIAAAPQPHPAQSAAATQTASPAQTPLPSPQDAKANAAGLTQALAQASNPQARSVLEALLAQAATAPAQAAPTANSAAPLAALRQGEDAARHLAETRVAAARQEEILRRVAAVAQPASEGVTASALARNEALAEQGPGAQLAALVAAQGAYSALSLAAITPVAGFGGRALRRAL